MTAPRVSILLPAFDAEATLAAALQSVVRQRETRWECVVVDDGSRDGTRALAVEVARCDPRVRVLGTPHRGLVCALNTGLAACRGETVARMDADDLMHRDRLGAQLAALAAAPALAAVGTHVRVFPRAGLRDGLRAYEAWLNGIDSARRVREEAFVECPVAHPTLMVRGALLHGLGYRDAGWPEDYDLILRLLAAGHEVGVVARRLHAWRDGPARLTRTGDVYRADRFTRLKAAFLADGFLRASDTYVLWGHGGTGRRLRRALAAYGKRVSHVVEVHPRRIGQSIDGAPVVPIEDLTRLRGRPLVASVAGARARRLIRERLDLLGFRETVDFVCAA